MTSARFQDQLGVALRTEPGLWVYHPPDGVAAQWKPGDWIIGRGRVWGIVEAKQTRTRTFPISGWTAQQRAFCRQVIGAGGVYWLVVSWRGAAGTRVNDTITFAYSGPDVLRYMEGGAKSLTGQEPFGQVIPWEQSRYQVGCLMLDT